MHRIFRNLKKWSILISCNTNQKNEFNYIYNKLNYLINKEKLNESIEILYLINDENISSNRKLLIEKSKSEWINFIDVNIDISNNFINEIFKNLDTDYIKFKKHFVNQNKSLIIENDYSFVIKKSLISDNYYNNNFFKPINSKILDNVLIFEKNEKKENISIIITAYESQDFIEECLNSVYNQTYFNDDNFEVLVGVDGCKKTYEKLNEIKYNYKNLKIFMMKDNKGTYITTNTLIEQTIFENIIRFDSDDTMFPTLVENVMDFKNDYDIVKIGSFDGIIYFKKSSMIDTLGGYQPWFVAADTELLKRAANKLKIGNLNIKLFNRRYHTNSLTNKKDTAIGSKMRNFYSSLIKTKYNDDEIKIDRVTNEIKIGRVVNSNEIKDKVLVIIPAYNVEETIDESIQSVLNQTHKNIRISIINDCSDDNTLNVINKYKNLDNLDIFHLQKNIGTYQSINNVLYNIKDYDYFTILGGDDIMMNDRISKHLTYLGDGKYNASISQYSRVDYKTKKKILTRLGESTILFSKNVFNTIGYFDNTRFGGDTEYVDRFKLKFKNSNLIIINDILTIAYNVDEKNLTKNIPLNGIERTDYIKKYKKEHNDMKFKNNFYRIFNNISSKNKIAIITTMWKRHNLTDFIFNYYNNLINNIKNDIDIRLFVAGSEGDLSKSIANKYENVYYIEVENFPLSQKHNDIMSFSRQWDPDGVVLIGSDDILSNEIFYYYDNYIKKDNKLPLGFLDVYFLWDNFIGYWDGYKNNREGESVGCGRFYPKNILDIYDWKMWGNEKLNKNLDGLATSNLIKKNIKVNTVKLKDINGYIIAIQSINKITTSINNIKNKLNGVNNFDYFFDFDSLKKILKNEKNISK